MNVIKMNRRTPRDFKLLTMYQLLEEMSYFVEKYPGTIISSLVLLEGVNLFTCIKNNAVTEELKGTASSQIGIYTKQLKRIRDR